MHSSSTVFCAHAGVVPGDSPTLNSSCLPLLSVVRRCKRRGAHCNTLLSFRSAAKYKWNEGGIMIKKPICSIADWTPVMVLTCWADLELEMFNVCKCVVDLNVSRCSLSVHSKHVLSALQSLAQKPTLFFSLLYFFSHYCLYPVSSCHLINCTTYTVSLKSNARFLLMNGILVWHD